MDKLFHDVIEKYNYICVPCVVNLSHLFTGLKTCDYIELEQYWQSSIFDNKKKKKQCSFKLKF